MIKLNKVNVNLGRCNNARPHFREAVDQLENTMLNKLIDPTSLSLYSVEKVKLNKAPRHFFDSDITVKKIKVNGVAVDFRMRKERTQYVLFSLTDEKKFTQHYYIRSHDVMESESLVTPKPK